MNTTISFTRLFIMACLLCNIAYASATIKHNNKPLSNYKKAIISGIIGDKAKQGNMVLYLYAYDYQAPQSRGFSKSRTYKLPIRNGRFTCVLDSLQQPLYFKIINLEENDVKRPEEMMLEPGDDIIVHLNAEKIFYTGKGANKLTALNKMNVERNKIAKLYVDQLPAQYKKLRPASLSAYIKMYKEQERAELRLLDSFKTQLSDAAFALMHADIEGRNGLEMYSAFDAFINRMHTDNEQIRQDVFLLYDSLRAYDPIYPHDGEWNAHSRYYPGYIDSKIRCDVAFFNRYKQVKPAKEYFQIAKENYSGPLREVLLTIYIKDGVGDDSLDVFPHLKEIIHDVKTPDFAAMVKEKEALSPGQAIMGFAFPDTSGKIVRLSDFKGRMVLIDFNFTGCNPCTAMAREMDKIEKELEALGVVAIAISIDKDQKRFIESARKNAYSARSSINLYTGGVGNKDPFVQRYVLKGYPGLVLINQDQKIVTCNAPKPWPGTKGADQLVALIKSTMETKK